MTRAREQAIGRMQAGDFEGALPMFKALLANEPNDWGLLYMAGQCARFTGDTRSAVSYLERAIHGNGNEPQIFLALGIAHQLVGQLQKSEDALRRALELDPDFVAAYNSLGMTQKKLGRYDLARHNLEEALRAISRHIAKSMSNSKSARIYPHPTARGTRWAQTVLEGATYLCARDGDVQRLEWPTAQQAIEEARSKEHGGLLWTDIAGGTGAKTRRFLPNFFNTFFVKLREDRSYASVLGNLGEVLEAMGKQTEASVCSAEAEEFAREG
jgi:tetratricopeptide (TPR) repeat protein